MIQPVTSDRHNSGEVIMMDMTDVLYIQIEDGAVVFYCKEGRFYPLVPSLSMYHNHMESIGFHRLDRTNLVNMNKVKVFDEGRGVVYFEDEAKPTSLKATVAFMNISKLKKLIHSWIARNRQS